MPAEFYISSTKYSLQERMTRRGKVYDVMFRIVTLDGVEKQKKLSGFATKTLAKQGYTDFVTSKCELVKNNPIKKKKIDKEVVRVDDIIPEYIASLFNQNKASSIHDKRMVYEKFVSPLLGDKPLTALTKEVLYQWQDALWNTINPKTNSFYSYKYLTKIRGHLGSMLSWAQDRYGIPSHLSEVKKPKRRAPKAVMSIWTREQFEQFISVVDDPTYHAFFTLLFFTGRRKGEIFALSPSDVKGKTIVFNKSLTRKTLDDSTYAVTSTKADKTQEIPVCSTVQEELQNYKGGSPFLFGGKKPLSDNGLRRAFRAYCEKARIEPIRIHDLRHSFASMLIHMGANFTVIAELIGDTVDQVIKTYGHMYESDKQKIIAEIG